MKKLNSSHARLFSAMLWSGLLALPLLAPAAYFTSPILQGQDPEVEVNGEVNEGPFGFTRNGRTFIVYSASGCWTDDYCLGLLTLSGTNLLDRKTWAKSGPVFTKQPGAYGPGHHGVFKDTNGQWWNIYHANNLSGQGCGGFRQVGIQRLAWDATGLPVFGAPVPIGSWITDDTNFLVAQFPLNETGGPTVANTTCGPSGLLAGSPAWANPGLQLNGATDYVDCGAAAANDVQNALTLSAWIRADAFVDWAGIIAKGTNTGPFAMQTWHDGALRFSANWGSPGGGVGAGSWNSDFKMATNQWYHAAVTYDGATVRFYLNGQLDSNQSAVALRFGVVNEPLILGADFPGGNEFFKGTIRDPRVYGRALSGSEVQTIARSQYTATIDPGLATVTNWEGWGTSLCWWANVVGGYANRNAYASLAFTSLKLNIVRYNIGGGEDPGIANTMEYRARMQGFKPTHGVWNWSADANQRWMLRQALALGANRVVAFANSPPWWMTVSGSVTGSADGTSNNLQTGYETDFAAYLATVVSNLTLLDGVTFDLVTPMNEPTGTWWRLGGRQEGCYMSADQQARMVNNLQAALTARNLAAGIDASEDSDEQSTINSINAYGAGQSNVALIASHSYGANNPGGIRNLSASLRKPAWISEYGDGDGTGLTMARRIHDDLTGAWVRAWVYWQVVDNAGGWGFLYNPLDGSGNTAYSINRKFYVMGQFSQYIRPGCQILGVNDNNSLAAYSPSNQTLIIVAVNDTTNSLIVYYNLNAFNGLPTQASAVRTSPTENLSAIAPLPIAGKTLCATLIPQSVTTLVLNNVIPAPPGSGPLAWYPFEGNAWDASGNGNDGTGSGAAFVTGELGEFAARFNGSSSYVQIPLVISNHFTISFWLKTTDTGATGQWWAGRGLVDGEVSGTTDDFGVSLVGGNVALGIGNPDTTITTASAVNDGQWHHVVATRNAVSGQMLVYLDGVLQASGVGPVGPKHSPPALRIGSIQPGYAGGFLNGTIDDVQVFRRVFGASEIGLLMNHPPLITSAPGSYNILAGRTMLVTNAAADPDLPAQNLSWSLVLPPVGASINATNGLFSWRPSMAQSLSTNIIVVRVVDNGTPVMSATQSFAVAVSHPQSPLLSVPAASNGALSLLVNGEAGPDYLIQSSTNLGNPSSWLTVFTNSSATPPFQWTDPAAAGSPSRFYRVLLAP
jgi:O-glycosyl hydrolase